ncbi:PLP-dependent aminotransferase family protein [uncultured Endozoicomonas sp.]|uniref:MocR-like pyridoxine biosynthesis transcription factor PdxR n=1 Tax=uncultured Endozoicomonas sp. TaxID=432652 RepID=UPI00261B25FA|nr:PLP-dependent aminotransferase family protein [uncultured Endozoicomonas sp.]
MDLRDIQLQQSVPERNGSSLSQQLFFALRQKILARQLSTGSRLPASRVLASDLGISRNTVNSAYEQLRAEGYVTSREGSGFFISAQLPRADLAPEAVSGKRLNQWPELSEYGSRLHRLSARNDKKGTMDNLPFTVGLPDFRLFPNKVWQQLIRRHCDRRVLMGYHDYQGYEPLRKALAAYLNSSRGMNCRSEQIVITQGAQHGLALCAQLLLNSGDQVLMEEPGYTGARNAFSAMGAHISPIRHSNNGINISELPETGDYRALCCTPTHQYPMGGILSASERMELLQWAERNQCWIIEDDYDSEFHYYSKPIAAMAGMAEQTPVIYMGSFSKTLLPGLRLGYLVVPEHLVDVFVDAKAFSSGETPLFTQAVVADFIEEGHFYRHLRRCRKSYQQKWEHMQQLCTQHLTGLMTPVAQSAGMHIALTFDDQRMDDAQVSKKFRKQEFGSSPLSSYYYSSLRTQGLVLGFANTTGEEREQGIAVLKPCLDRSALA